MDVDSRMTTESDSDSNAAAEAAHGGSAGGSGSGSETSSSSAPSTPGTLGMPTAAPNPAAAGAAGPRPAPGYTVVNAVIEKKEDGPGCPCGAGCRGGGHARVHRTAADPVWWGHRARRELCHTTLFGRERGDPVQIWCKKLAAHRT
ncbi:serine/threonine-protein phosphatase BSL2 homolog [Miscanthus floridulus]|uniref:serine/threonine-protein phosphatase BSL2 homolog n=1 Tax=Miscanthus floridulus TaxID=154761 RepID=UPI0034587954